MASLRTITRSFELATRVFHGSQRRYTTHLTDKQIKVVVLGASGSVGQPLALLLKHSPLISKLALYDNTTHAPAIAEDLNHIETKCQVEGYLDEEQLTKALAGAAVVILPAGIRRRSGMSSEDFFNTNASIVQQLATSCAKTCPQAVLGILSIPVNSTVAVASEAYKKEGVYDPKKIFGVTTLEDVVRGNTFLAQLVGVDPSKLDLPVVGGHSGVTSVPLFSQSGIKTSLSKDQLLELTERVQDIGTDANSKAGYASLALACAYSAARFTFSTLRGLMGAPDVVECAYVKSDVTDSPYFATPVLLGTHGMKENLGLGTVTVFEQDLIAKAIPEIKKDIKMGEAFAANPK